MEEERHDPVRPLASRGLLNVAPRDMLYRTFMKTLKRFHIPCRYGPQVRSIQNDHLNDRQVELQHHVRICPILFERLCH